MDKTEVNPEAVRILKTIFAGVEGDKISRENLLDRVSLKTYYNYGPTLYKNSLARPLKSGNKVSYIQLTKLGKQVMSNGDDSDTANRPASSKGLGLLEEITKLTDQFNNQSSSWKWELIRKGGANHQ